MDELNINQIVDVAFRLNNKSHIKLIQQTTDNFSKALKKLQSTDRNIILGAALGTGCWLGTWLLPLVTACASAFSFAAWNAAKRFEVYQHYNKAFKDLMAVYQWTLYEDDVRVKLGNETIQTMIRVLAPLVKAETLCTWSGDDLKAGGFSFYAIKRRADMTEDMEELLKSLIKDKDAGKTPGGWGYLLYGEGGMEEVWKLLQWPVNLSLEMPWEVLGSRIVQNPAP